MRDPPGCNQPPPAALGRRSGSVACSSPSCIAPRCAAQLSLYEDAAEQRDPWTRVSCLDRSISGCWGPEARKGHPSGGKQPSRPRENAQSTQEGEGCWSAMSSRWPPLHMRRPSTTCVSPSKANRFILPEEQREQGLFQDKCGLGEEKAEASQGPAAEQGPGQRALRNGGQSRAVEARPRAGQPCWRRPCAGVCTPRVPPVSSETHGEGHTLIQGVQMSSQMKNNCTPCTHVWFSTPFFKK